MTQSYRLTIEEICNKLRPVFGKKIDDLYLRYAMADSMEEKYEIEHIVNALYHKHLSELLNQKLLLEPPAKELMDGEYPLAMISYAGRKLYPFALRERDWIRHFCISGMSGSGKTTLAFHVVKNFIDKDKPFLIFDWKKSFRPLMLIDGEIMNFTVGNENVSNLFKININKPPEGISAKEWINTLCDLMTESFFASYGVHKVLLETLDDAFKDFGVYSGSQNYPTWNEIKWRLENKLEKTRGRNAAWLESALRVAHVLTFGNFGKALNYKGKDSLTVEDLLNKKVIFELNALGTVEKKFFCEFILTHIYKLKKAKQIGLSQDFNHAILVDEAHNIFLKDKTHFVKESVTDVIYREMREYGTSLICLDQHISKLSDTVAGNSACHVAFQQQLPQDIETISGLTQLRDRKNYFSMLPVGTAIVKLSERYSQPFLIEVPEVKLREKEVSDLNVKERMNAVFTGKKLEAGEDKEFMKAITEPESSVTAVEILDDQIENPENKVAIEEPKKPELTELENRTIETEVIMHALTPVQQILHEYVEKKLDLGSNIREIEKILEQVVDEGNYSISDVSKVINFALENKFNRLNENFPKNVVTSQEEQNTKIYKSENNISGSIEMNKLSNEQERFLAFLQANKNHNLSTVEIYKLLNLSARKGTKIKNELLEQGKIKIEEKKYEKGWKKLIRIV